MRRTSRYPLMGVLVLACGFARGQGPEGARNALEAQLAPPEILMRFRETLRITPEQEKFFKEQIEAIGPEMEKVKQRMDRAGAGLHEALGADAVDEGAARAKLAEVLDAEREGKLLQFGLLVRINNRLEPEQRRACRVLRKELGPMPMPPEERERELHGIKEKIELVKRLAQERFGESGPPPELPEQMDKIQRLVREGQVPQAEAMINDMIGHLKERPPASAP